MLRAVSVCGSGEDWASALAWSKIFLHRVGHGRQGLRFVQAGDLEAG